MLNRSNFLTVILLLAVITSQALAQKVGTTSFQFLKVMTDARSTGMGNAYAAVTSNSDAVFWNPGALTKTSQLDFSFSHMDYFLDVTHYAVSAAYTLGSYGTIGMQGAFVDVGEIEVTRVSELGVGEDEYIPGTTGEYIHPLAMVFGISYAKGLTDKFSFGITAKFIHEDMGFSSALIGGDEEVNVSALAFDMGLIYKTGFRSLELAAVIRHFGPEVTYIDGNYPMPQTFDIGVSGYLIGPSDNFGIISNDHTLLFAADLLQPRDYDQQYHVGFEYGYWNMLFLRTGYKFNYDEESYSFGFGLNYKQYRIDYSFAEFGDFLDSVHRFSIGFNL